MDISSVLQGGYQHPLSRSWQAQRSLTKSMLMYPIFITDDPDACVEIPSLPGQCRWGVNRLEGFLGPLVKKGLKSVILFGPVISAVRKLRTLFPTLYIACDVCLCEYTSHGHCGVFRADGSIDTEPSAARIAEVALAYAQAGAHCVAPSDMMDGRIKAIKRALIDGGFGNQCTLMSYSAKFASALYGPFRDAAGSAPSFGDRKMLSVATHGEGLARRAIRGAISSCETSPAILDVIQDAKELAPDHPLACYQVSGEYAMVVAGARAGVYDLRTMAFETVESMIRAGCTLILTYFTPAFLDWLDE
ncbi:Delta-aminolevulinic acid dehydratase [Grifola frondosa]|uniref:porphobilinogen synthase n=1 Tax=Grifola frondosa TaxID=5627 RepID=A0A1C7LTD7_GRIFR|nr:Delta-aminolevulinic acid dehydratase [Grifola frondosa]